MAVVNLLMAYAAAGLTALSVGANRVIQGMIIQHPEQRATLESKLKCRGKILMVVGFRYIASRVVAALKSA